MDVTSTQHLLERIGPIRHTHYGAFWEFTADMSKHDTAYSNIHLGAHTDTTYFTEPAGLQLFHLLDFQGDGGESLFVDGFRAASNLSLEDPGAYEILSQTRITAHSAGNEDICIQPTTPFTILTHNHRGKLTQIRWNNDDRSTMDVWAKAEDVPQFYDALRKWNDILTRDSSEFWVQLQPGVPVVFDNWRILHGRSAFT